MIAKSIRTVLLFIAGLAAAQGLARAGELYVPGRGTLTIPLPAVWQETHRGLSGECSVEMVFERPGPVRGSLQVTVAWSPQGDPAFSTPESVRRSCLSSQRALEGQTVEKELPLQPLDGPQAAGFLISYPADPGVEGAFLAQWYFETIHRGKWLELHFSEVFRNGEDVGPTHAEVLRLVRSLRLPPDGR